MGRYKRHNKTKTFARNNPMSPKVSHYGLKKKEKSKFVNKSPMAKKLVGDLLLSLKKRNKFANLYSSYKPLTTNDIYNPYLPRERYINFFIGNNLRFMGGGYGYGHYESKDYSSLFGRVCILNELLTYNEYKHPLFSCGILPKEKILEYYVKDIIEKEGIKVYPNQEAMGALFGTIFASIAYIISIIFLSIVISPIYAFWFSLFILTLLSFKPTKHP